MFPCAYKQLFGIDCPLCGFQRSLVLLFNGEFVESLIMFPPLIPILSYSLILVFLAISGKIFRTKAIRISSMVILIIILVNYLLKLFKVHSFETNI